MKPLNSLEKRDLLAARKFDPAHIRAYGDEYFAQERYGEAFEFYRKIADADGIRKVKEVVIRLGDPEVLWRIQQCDGTGVGDADWIACGDNAMKLGKYRSAAYCYERVKQEAKLAEALRVINPASATAPALSPQPQ